MTDPTPLLDRLEAVAKAGSAKWGGPARNEVLLALVEVARAAATDHREPISMLYCTERRERRLCRVCDALSRLAALGQTEEQQ